MTNRMSDERLAEWKKRVHPAYEYGYGVDELLSALRAERTFANEQTHRLAICEAKESVARAAYEKLLAAATAVVNSHTRTPRHHREE